MYGIPRELNLEDIVGEEATQVAVGQFDLQLAFGKVQFVVESKIVLRTKNQLIGSWNPGSWPDKAFYDLMNVPVSSFATNEKEIVITLENGIDIYFKDDSDQYETMQIYIEGQEPWII